jgi:uncharacterized RDD family membrane protein YckC
MTIIAAPKLTRLMEQLSLLTDLEFIPVLAGTGKRFLNLLLDIIIYYVLLFCFGAFLALTGRSEFAANDNNTAALYLSVFAIYVGYFFLCELIFKGRTIGKLLTGTKVVNEDGSDPTAKTYFLRSLCRIVPFEPFSAFGVRPWHDRWTGTYVIDVKKTSLNVISFQ